MGGILPARPVRPGLPAQRDPLAHMAGGNYVASENPFPKGFAEAVQAEIAAAR